MKVVEIKISKTNTKINTLKGNSTREQVIRNSSTACCIEQYLSADSVVSMSVTDKGDADVFYQAWARIKEFFVIEECFFGANLMLIIKSSNLKIS